MIIFTPCERCTIVRPPGAKHGWYTGVRVIFCAEATDDQLQSRLTYLDSQAKIEALLVGPDKPVPYKEASVNVPPDALREAGVPEEQVKILHNTEDHPK